MEAAEPGGAYMKTTLRLQAAAPGLQETVQIIPSNFLPLKQRCGSLTPSHGPPAQSTMQTLRVPSTPRSALELTLATSLIRGSPSESLRQRPASLKRTGPGSGRQAPVAKLSLEAGASPRSIAVSDALIASFQHDPGAHETFRPVHHTAKASQRAAKLAHLKAAWQAQRLARPQTSPAESSRPSSRPSSKPSHHRQQSTSSQGPEAPLQDVPGHSSPAPSTPTIQPGQEPPPSGRSPDGASRMPRARALSARPHYSQPLDDPDAQAGVAGRLSSEAVGTVLPAGRVHGQAFLNLLAPGAFMPRQRTAGGGGLGSGSGWPHAIQGSLHAELGRVPELLNRQNGTWGITVGPGLRGWQPPARQHAASSVACRVPSKGSRQCDAAAGA
ncbi:hypothetical protein WJX84_011126 [Apatococcus fuscideae]|uniref:Uncharacterized protein n=1 Tax=Apatococcus fuscideae TaxID=2026836 RepID=A0AAW1TFQ3_9CHLO